MTASDEIRTELIARMESVPPRCFRQEKASGQVLIGDILGSPGDSLEVVLDGDKAGLWTDLATAMAETSLPDRRLPPRGQRPPTFPGARRGLPICSVVRDQCRYAAPRRKRRLTISARPRQWDYFDATGKLIAVVLPLRPTRAEEEFRRGMPSGAR